MKKTLRVALVVLLAGAVALVALHATKPKEPVYQGRTLSQWLDDYNRMGSKNPNGPLSKLEPIDDAIRAMGTNCLPFLLANLLHRQPAIQQAFWSLAKRQSVIKFNAYGEDSLENPSLLAFHALGDQALPILPELSRRSMVADNDELGSIEMAAIMIGSNAAPVFEVMCASTNQTARWHAGFDLGQINADLTVDYSWTKALVNGKPLARVGVHSEQGGLDRAWVRLLREGTNASVRRAVIEAAVWWHANSPPGSRSEELNQALASATNDAGPVVRGVATGSATNAP